jgi:hypothetical protein
MTHIKELKPTHAYNIDGGIYSWDIRIEEYAHGAGLL